MPVPQSLLVAIGGNATHPDSIRGTTEEQERVAERAAQALLPLIRSNNRILITHGNGPVVGKILMRMMLTRDQIPPMRLDVCVAHSQGGIGYILIQALENAMRRAGIERPAACVVTQVEVDARDPAFDAPSKPIGPFFSEPEARELEAKGWRMMEDAGRGWRHCVASPEPRAIINLHVIRALLDSGTVLIAGGGGGIPVVRDASGDWQGVQAVVDKDLTSALLARSLGVPDLLILTAVDRVAIDFNTPRQRHLDKVTLAELKRYQQAGQFAKGSMEPKVEAAIRHLEGGGRRAIIGHLERALPALRGESGTHVIQG
ncbi:MAG: carbamate kinase [Betaproteobacteria bacterium RIFCSPLOWO2_12_FULL_65_14]|nr:MAG: carbamate kinase [Betaproteobacteria bacterium RIFCSPLOWO2_12_FULL_65_14]